MKLIHLLLPAVIFSLWLFQSAASAQSMSVTDRTPEQEATIQTEKLQKELKLSDEQVKRIYEINLRYAYERRQSNQRSDAVNRIRKKNNEIDRVLNDKQRDDLRSARQQVQQISIGGERYGMRTKSGQNNNIKSTSRSTSESAVSGSRPVNMRNASNANSENPPQNTSDEKSTRNNINTYQRSSLREIRSTSSSRSEQLSTPNKSTNTERNSSGSGRASSSNNSSRNSSDSSSNKRR